MLIALLCQTELIYRVELPIRDGVPQLLDSRALARAIAFALTDTVPDERLATAAIEGRLATREQVESQVWRILDDASIAKPRLLRFFREYFGYAAADNPTINALYNTLLHVVGAPREHFNLIGADQKNPTLSGPLKELLA